MTGDDDLIRRGEVLELRDAIADSIGAKPGSSIHSALCKYANAIAALPAVQPAAVAPDAILAALRAERDTLRARPVDVAAAARDVLAERARQINAEGWTPEHDDQYGNGELPRAARAYILTAHVPADVREAFMKTPPSHWPWDKSWWKPKTRRRDLVRAGALILAEIERLDRAALAALPGDAT